MYDSTMANPQALAAAKSAFASLSEQPFCSGTVPLDANNATLFYRSNGQAGFVNFTDATEQELASLAKACQPATFGVEQKDVLDESYRKAGKMDAADFAIQFSPATSGILDTVRDALLPAGSDDKNAIQMELYKLNVYGPGSFFKSHVDTPRSDTMFGSLVVVLPTSHEGGALLLRHRGQEHAFNTASAVKVRESPSVAFVAFYSDIEHEVSVVTSGYRVTITYNLYFSSNPSPRVALDMSRRQSTLQEMKNTLSTLLSDPGFLPEGGLIGFGLSHKYPFDPKTTYLAELMTRLKGSDADILEVCNSLSLNASLKAIYNDKTKFEGARRYCLLDSFADIGEDGQIEYDIVDHLKEEHQATLVYDIDKGPLRRAKPIVWIKPLNDSNQFQQPFIAYGNEATLYYAWGDVCLVAHIDGKNQEEED